MYTEHTGDYLMQVLQTNLKEEQFSWLQKKLQKIVQNKSGRELYLTYTLLHTKVSTEVLESMASPDQELNAYLTLQKARQLDVARIVLLVKVLENDTDYFKEKVAKLIEVADKGELEIFLKFLIVLPNSENYLFSAVEALRTNIATVFDAIALNNPYPSIYFNEQQWNQMYLKAAFMQRDLFQIIGIDERANEELTRIISDYAHERWAASREIDFKIWRPVVNFMNTTILEDMEVLFKSSNPNENKMAALICAFSVDEGAQRLSEKYPEQVALLGENLNWNIFG